MIIFADVNQLAGFLESAQKAHHLAEKRLSSHAWEQWYAAYMVARTQGHSGRSAEQYAYHHITLDDVISKVSDPNSGSTF